MSKQIRIHLLRCGYMRVSETVPFGGGINLKNSARQVFSRDSSRVVLPVNAFLIEHPSGRFLVDTGWSREISPKGEYDPAAVSKLLPKHLAQFYRPWLPEGMAVHEQLAAMGIRPSDLDAVIITHLDPDHVSGVKALKDAKRILLAEDEYFWTCRNVYRARQPQSAYAGVKMEHFWYRGTDDGPNRWAFDLLGDGTIRLVNVPGHTDGQCAVLISNGELLEHKQRFVLLTADAAFAPKNWEQGITPGFGFDPTLQRRALDWIAAKAKHPGCLAVFTSHDPASEPQTVTIDLN